MKSSESNPVREFLRRLDDGELEEGFSRELRKLSPQHRRDVCDALVKRSEEFLISRSAVRSEILASQSAHPKNSLHSK